MNHSKNIISIFLIISMFISNIGFILHEDCCYENAKLILNVFNEESCCSENLDEDNCCSENSDYNAQIIIDNKNCSGHCYSINRYVKLDINQINFVIEKYHQHFEIICNILIEEINSENQNYFSSNLTKELPNIWGRSLVISLHKEKIPDLLKS